MTTHEMEKSIQEIWNLFKETDKKFKETDKEIDKLGKSVEETRKTSDKHAYRSGLFVIGESGETAVILNDKGFKPKVW